MQLSPFCDCNFSRGPAVCSPIVSPPTSAAPSLTSPLTCVTRHACSCKCCHERKEALDNLYGQWQQNYAYQVHSTWVSNGANCFLAQGSSQFCGLKMAINFFASFLLTRAATDAPWLLSWAPPMRRRSLFPRALTIFA